MKEGRLLRLALWLVRGISSRSIHLLLDRYGSFEEAAHASKATLAEVMNLGKAAARQLEEAPADLLGWAAREIAGLSARGGTLVFRGDPDYPDFGSLRDPPEVLFLRGALSQDEGAVAVVGARRADPGALVRAHRLGFSLARAGRLVVSGGAFGVDARAHQGALDAGGRTLAILGSGVLLPLPARNRRLFSDILERGGGLASELPPTANARPEFFPRRNRLVAGLSSAVVVVRASATSGSLHTARYALQMGKPVYVFPSEEASNAGAQLLLGEGAIPVTDERALFARMDGGEGAQEGGGRREPLDDEGRLLDALGGPPISLVELAQVVEMNPARVASLLGALCAGGKVRAAGPGRFIRVTPPS